MKSKFSPYIIRILLSLALVSTAASARADTDTENRLNMFVVETHPISWFIWGPNLDFTVMFKSPVGIFTELQYYGLALLTSDQVDEDEDPSSFGGYNTIVGVYIKPMYFSKGLEGLYIGLAYDRLNLKLSSKNKYYMGLGLSENLKDEIEINASGPRVNIGWRGFFDKHIIGRIGIYGGYYTSQDIDYRGYPEKYKESKKYKRDDKNALLVYTSNINFVNAGIEFAVGLGF